MKKLARLFFLVLLIGAAVPVSASENTRSAASITFYPPVNKVIPMKQVRIPEERNQVEIETTEKMSEENIAGFLPKTNEERIFFSEIMGIGFLGMVLFFVIYRRIEHSKTSNKKKPS
ncbi:LPXTG-motif protein cell wall anchor domain protein [Enterococcus faecalis 13-SD-W-01]|nr:LPXTG-motif protein cell wall anchor domain protein [Enterococcus faecalis 13-SD-W-01]